MAKPRNWTLLAASTQKRYTNKGAKQGLTPAQVEAAYMSGRPLGDWRGHPKRPHASERQWGQLVKAAKAADLGKDVDGDYTVVLDSLLQKGYAPAWILQKLAEKKESRDTFLLAANVRARKQGHDMAGRQPGRRRYFGRSQPADIELYYYH